MISPGQSISIVTSDELDDIQGPDLTRVLTRLPGVSYSRNGGLGGQTGLNVRGANADQLLVLVDGVRIADYASPGGGYDLGNLMGGNLSKLELLRGSNSVVWGSQAIGGVLAVTTEELDGARASAEYGAYDTALLSGGAGIAGDGHAIFGNRRLCPHRRFLRPERRDRGRRLSPMECRRQGRGLT